MKSIFDLSTREELIKRINTLNAESKAIWGKMNVYQMSKHCTIWNNWFLGNGNFIYKQDFLGKIFGKIALKSNTKNDSSIGKNIPTGKAFKIKEKTGNLKAETAVWEQQIKAYERYSNDNFIHDFFGKMTKEQIGIFAYKHNDHHLRQFGV